jgi:GDP-L-fucose synthase
MFDAGERLAREGVLSKRLDHCRAHQDDDGGDGVGVILVTGGTGFVGRHLQEEMTRRGLEYAVFASREYDLTVREQADAVFERYAHATLIVHLACYQAAGDFPAKHTAQQFNVNNLIHTHVLEAWRRFAPHARLVAVGSSCAYPSGLQTMTEERILDGPPDQSVYSYAQTKRLLYTGLLAYNDQYKLNGSYLVPPTLFGEHDDFHVATAHVCGALMGKFVRAVKAGEAAVEIWGDGSQVREFLYVKDFVKALLDLSAVVDRDTINVGPGRGTTIRVLAETISRAAGFTGRLNFNPDRYVGVKEKYLTATKLQQKYGLHMSDDITAGVQRTVAWLLSHAEVLAGPGKFADARV